MHSDVDRADVTPMRRGVRLGVDVGDVRVGVARSDPDGMIATPEETVAAGPGDVERIIDLADELRRDRGRGRAAAVAVGRARAGRRRRRRRSPSV